MHLLLEIILFTILFLLSAFFSGVETAFISLNRLRLLHLVREGSRRAKIVQRYLLDTTRIIGTTLTGNNLVNVALTAHAASLAERYLNPLGVSLAGVATVCALVIFGEFLPKLYFTSRPLERTLQYVDFFRLCEYILKPASRIIIALTDFITPGKTKTSPFSITREHIISVVKDENDPHGAQITPFERYMINRVFDLQARTARQVMTPLSRLKTLTPDSTLETAFDYTRGKSKATLLILSPDKQTCLGIFDTFATLCDHPIPDRTAPALRYALPPLQINADTPADDILPLMRRYKRNTAAIIEPGTYTILGLVTQEHILNLLTQGIKRKRA